MFDDDKPKKATQAAEPEDIFADVDPTEGKAAPSPKAPSPVVVPASDSVPSPAPALAEKGGDSQIPANLPGVGSGVPVSKPVSASAPSPAPVKTLPGSPVKKSSGGKKVFKVIGIVIVAILIIIFAAILAFSLMVQPTEIDILDDIEVVDEDLDMDDEGFELVDDEGAESDLQEVDSDGDGLTDGEEMEAGTDPNMADTDQDGLGDREEVQVYDTDPLDTDTDNDTYSDGDEVDSGYNPNGEGKLFELPSN